MKIDRRAEFTTAAERGLILSVAAACILLFCATVGLAQTDAAIIGTVVDPSGATVPGVNITVKNLDTNRTDSQTTTARGQFNFQSLPIGNYEVTFELSGFKKVVQGPVVLTLSQTARLDLGLSLADKSDVVNIGEDAPIINATNSVGGTTFGGQRLTDLPNQGMGVQGGGFRDPYSLGTSVPGVSTINTGNAGPPLGTDFAVNGNNLRSNTFNVDGQNVIDPTSAGRQLTWNNPDAIGEFRMTTNQPPAELGGATGAVVSLVTKRGANNLHGSLFWFHNSNSFNSRSNLDKAGGFTEAPLRIENQFGGTVGGPIVRNRTFFFGSLQRWTDRNLFSGMTISSAPTEAGRSLLQANGGSRVTTQALLANLPAAQSGQTGVRPYCFNPTPWAGPGPPPGPTADPNNPGQFICAAAWSLVNVPVGMLNNSNLIRYDNWQWSIRLDHKINSSHSLNGRYMFNDDLQDGAGQATPPGIANTVPSRSQAATIGLTSTLKPTLLNEFRLSWSRYAFRTGPQNSAALSIPSIEIPDLGLTGATSIGPRTAIGYPTNLPESRRNNIYQLVNNTAWTTGGHTLKWGVDIRKQDLASYFNPNLRGQLRYSSLTNFVADFADTTATINSTLPGGQPWMYFNWTDWFFFVQDDWKLTRNLTLNIGLRYELPGNSIESIYPVNDNIVAANGGDPLFRYNSRPPQDTNNLMPRIGFNWNLGGRGIGFLNKTVLRGGYARSNDYTYLIMPIQVTGGFPFQAAFNIAGTPGTMANLPNATSQPLTVAAAQKLSQTQLSSDFHTPYSDQYSLEVQRGVGLNNVVRVGYVGTKGTGLFQSLEGNPVTRCGDSTPPCPRVDPTRGVIRLRANTGSSIYHSMQISFEHRYYRGVSGGAHYTWSTFIDTGSDIVNPSTSEVATPQDPFNRNNGERARSTYDRPHRLTGNIVYELPFLKNHQGAVGYILGGWQMGTLATLQTGSPFTVLNGSDPGNVLLGSLTGSAIRPNFAPGVSAEELGKVSVSEIRRQVIEAGSPSVFFRAGTTNGGPTAAAPIGNVPRNLLRSDGLVSIDLNIIKNFKFNGDRRLQIRADFFNLPNTRNFGIPNATATTTAFNFLNEGATDGGNRRIFLSARFAF